MSIPMLKQRIFFLLKNAEKFWGNVMKSATGNHFSNARNGSKRLQTRLRMNEMLLLWPSISTLNSDKSKLK